MKSKAQEKRDRQLRERLNFLLKRKLRDFKNNYLGDYAEYKNNEIKREIKGLENLIDNSDKLRSYNEGLFDAMNDRQKRWFNPITKESLQHKLDNCEVILKANHINFLRWYREADKNYNQKLERVIDKLVQYEIGASRMTVEKIGGGTSRDFGFLISDEKIVVHARVIYACGEIKIPHYRFIVTKRK